MERHPKCLSVYTIDYDPSKHYEGWANVAFSDGGQVTVTHSEKHHGEYWKGSIKGKDITLAQVDEEGNKTGSIATLVREKGKLIGRYTYANGQSGGWTIFMGR